ncbi:hypothetical protein HK104_000010 [Borealophlyctis nickersoniae]|nr:hypothetical protein HK104_000010 [Borealophlyctis nickersoniae]
MSAQKRTPPQVDVNKAVGFQYPGQKVRFNRRELSLYALGIGLSDPKYVYELDKNFVPFPTYPLVLPLKGDSFDVTSYAEKASFGNVPGLPKLDLNRLVHGEQYFEVLAPLPKEGEFELKSKLAGVYDAGKGMVLDQETTLLDSNNKPYVKMISSAFVIGYGGWNGPRKPKQANAVDTPQRAPDMVDVSVTAPNQALIYRLSGYVQSYLLPLCIALQTNGVSHASDYNPLHIDPRIGQKLGMKGAILHGLCTYGYAAAAVLRHFGNNDPANFKSIYGRFASPVYPGETLETLMWKAKEEGGLLTVAFVTKVKERDVVVISSGTVILLAKSKL